MDEAISQYCSLGLSVGSAMATFFFWLVKAKNEQPNLRIYNAAPQFAGYAASSCGETIKLVFDVKAVVANYSSMPNAVLAADGWVKLKEGQWHDAEVRLDAKTPLPLNLAPLQTVRLDLSLTLAVPAIPEGEQCRNTNETFALYRQRFVADPLEVKIELKTLGEKLFADVLKSARRAA